MWEAAYEVAYEVWEELHKIVFSPSPHSPHSLFQQALRRTGVTSYQGSFE
ncbi:MAG: hypothetical protein F6J93_07840 [Oscillatoria sp. SIO1A7]|nr:hypothetical protein [Oscillatoria sp. SIO1A7]